MFSRQKRKELNETLETLSKRRRSTPQILDEDSLLELGCELGELIMFCWGSTLHGELGLGGIDQDHILAPQQLLFNEAPNVIQVACGDNHTVMLTRSGEVYACGNNDHGQLGHTKTRTKPELVDGLSAYRMAMVASGGSHSLSFNEWGLLFGWGSDAHGQLGLTGETQPSPKIIRTLATKVIVQIACGQTHSLALTNCGELYAWGGNGYGQLGLGKKGGTEQIPVLVQSLKGVPIAFICCGAYHSFAITKSGAVFGWGCNTDGQLGLNDTLSREYPTQLRTHRSFHFKFVACGEDFSVFLSADGGVFTCGAGVYGQLGHGSTAGELLPRKVMELMGSIVTQIACGRKHALALVPSRGRVYAFGLGGSGQLGSRAVSNATIPQVVFGPWVSPSGVAITGALPCEDSVIVTRIFSGGDQCFVTVSPAKDDTEPEDGRIFPKKSQILSIKADKVSLCRKIKKDMIVDQDIFTYLEVVFRSIACFNSSFLLPNDEHYCCSSRNHGVDIRLAENIFGEIARIENESLKDLIWDGITESLIPSLSPNPPDVEALRLFVTLPLYHQFENPKHVEKLQGPFAKCAIGLKPGAHKVIGSWWTILPTEYFERLVRVYKNIVAFQLLQIDREKGGTILFSKCIVDCLDFLALLNKLNRSVEDQCVPCDTFYLPELNDVIDVRVDYVEWITSARPKAGKLYFCNYPFLFDAQAKTALLQADQMFQMQSAMQQAAARSVVSALFRSEQILTEDHFLCLNVCRDKIVQTTIDQLMSCSPCDLKKPLRVRFIGEEAEDAGGVRKEFFLLLMKEVLDPKYGMFKNYDEARTIWFNEVCFEDEIMFNFIGCLCGLAIYNFTIIDLPFPLALYKKLLGEKVTYQDLKGLSPTLFRSLQNLLDYNGDDVEDVFSLTFEISQDVYGEVRSVELKENGSRLTVSQSNKQEFVELYANYILNKSIESQFVAFSAGFNKVCGGKVLQIFNSQELMALVVGNENYDWDVFEENAEYRGGYTRQDPTICLFWEVFKELSHEDKKNFLLFLTGSDRIPIQGMKVIKIIIQPTNDDKFLPVAHTCFNLLDLPRYQTKERLKYKLLQAIQQHQGFSLV